MISSSVLARTSERTLLDITLRILIRLSIWPMLMVWKIPVFFFYFHLISFHSYLVSESDRLTQKIFSAASTHTPEEKGQKKIYLANSIDESDVKI